MPGSGTVLGRYVRAILRAADAAGTPVPALLEAAELDPGTLDDPEGRVPVKNYQALWQAIHALCPDPYFGLHFAESLFEYGALDALGFLLRSSDTIGVALERLSRYWRILNDDSELEGAVTREGDRLHIVVGARPPAPPWSPHRASQALAAIIVLGRRWAVTETTPEVVRFVHAAPDDPSEYRRVFGCPVQFECEKNEIIVDVGAMGIRIRYAEPQLAEVMTERTEHLLRARSGDMLDDVRRAIVRSMPNGEIVAHRVAKSLGMTERTLQRRLRERQSTFSQVVDEARRDVALDLCRAGHLSVAEIAFLVGFADPKGFRRAFRRWTGRSPALYRRERPTGK
jgi:AraC-like DNA-binding protein